MRAYEFITEDIFRSGAPCMPLAILRVSGKERDEVQNVCMANDWRESGMDIGSAIIALKSFGISYKPRFDLTYYKTETTDPLLKGSGFMDKKPRTLNMLMNIIPGGKFIVIVRKHAVAIIDGELFDDANVGRKHRVQEIIEII